ncbi:hypothetical protein [Gloeobacter violaceus]|uniref:Gsl4096 protein n=1 Tax=Gloeobacter violaceus (strain ATCC 29082 / PCC 7421) TaxID=251221 RepID=Q7NDY6_GLOVI|nr:hypothetical protein [Gloeobacter violaceus]BAC92037.1 gsl4096 [Gloeobacter violaceus PCC 7421]
MESGSVALTHEENEALDRIAQQTGKTSAELLHEALAEFIARFSAAHRRQLLQQAQGMWKDRDDLPVLRELRREFDRPED